MIKPMGEKTFMSITRRLVLATGLALAAGPALSSPPGLTAFIASPRRSAANVKRDRYRHPAALLAFWGLAPAQSVLEIEPGGGYWTEILAPYLKAKGHYTAALPSGTAEAQAMQAAFLKKLGTDPRDFSLVSTVPLTPGQPLGDAGTYDLIISCRNLHNWLAAGTAKPILAAIFAALKPGGVFGIEDHRASTSAPQDPHAKSGYVREDYARALIESAGFTYAASTEIGANKRDTKNYPDGVWDLPLVLRQGETNRALYLAIGESDRWTMKFTKPA
jgi:predicted methyltransferase